MKKIVIIILILIAAIQFITIDKENPTADFNKDFIQITNPPEEFAQIIKSSCYDCHSYHTKYPWYSNVAPVSWLLKNHVEDGRKHLNFSIWTDYKEAKKNHKIEECIEVIESEEMPMKGYILLHDEADLTPEQRKRLTTWFLSVLDTLK